MGLDSFCRSPLCWTFLVRVYCILSSQFHLVSDPLTLLGLSQSPDGYAVIEQGRLLNGAEQVMGSLPPPSQVSFAPQFLRVSN